ncbi:MAG: hypothetical protein EP330_09235 [Deltaproteobacteria bacterium]|nr:MAG: hypothetical protein EP330_09235 [Deltaproteobacteria bacterium]
MTAHLSRSFSPQWSVHGVDLRVEARGGENPLVGIGAVSMGLAIGTFILFGSALVSLAWTLAVVAFLAVIQQRQIVPLLWHRHYRVRITPVGLEIAPFTTRGTEQRLAWADVYGVSPTLRPHPGLVLDTDRGAVFLPAHHSARQLDRLADLLGELAAAEERGQAPAELLALVASAGDEEVAADGVPEPIG